MKLSFSYPYTRGMPTAELVRKLEDTAMLHDFQFARSRVTWSDAWTGRDGGEWITATVDAHPRTERLPRAAWPREPAAWERRVRAEAERLLERIQPA